MTGHSNRVVASRLLFLVLCFALPAGARGQTTNANDVFDQFFRFGDTAHKVYAQEAPGETVDPFSGTLRIVQEDLVLPGKAGLDLHIVRTYSSKIWSRADLFDSTPLLAETAGSVLGYGWTFHMGRLLNPEVITPSIPCQSGEFPVFEGPDGESRVFYPVPSDATNPVFISKDRWRLERNCPALGGQNAGACVWSTSGIRYELAKANAHWDGTRPVWPVSGIVDPNGNRITVSYRSDGSGAIAGIDDTYSRHVGFTYRSGDDGLRLEEMTANGKTYRYVYTTYDGTQTGGAGRQRLPGPRRFLTQMIPPAGGSYGYGYGFADTVQHNQYALTSISYPHGGSTTYAYDAAPFFTGNDTVLFPVVVSKTESGRKLAPATWTYAYSAPAPNCVSCAIDPVTGRANYNVTTITRPDGRHDRYMMYGFGFAVDEQTPQYSFLYLVGLTSVVSRADGAEIEWFGWEPDEAHTISTAPFKAPAYGGSCGTYLYDDVHVVAPLQRVRFLQKDGGEYLTEYGDWDQYGQARTVTETGAQAGYGDSSGSGLATPWQVRTTTWTFFAAETDGGNTLNMVHGRPLSQRVCIAGDCVDNTWTYRGPGHLRDTQTLSGVSTWFGYDPADGDLQSVTNALGETLRLGSYVYGVPTVIDLNGAYQVRRSDVTPEGWFRGETDGRGYTTRYEYDAIGRPLSVQPPGNSLPTTYDYRPDGRADGEAVRKAKGAYWSVSELDGSGRVVATADSEGTLSQTGYDAMGIATFVSYPYRAAPGVGDDPPGDLIVPDGLGRPTLVVKGYRRGQPAATCEGDGVCAVGFGYLANCTRTTVQRGANDYTTSWRCNTSYGDPGEGRLTSLNDALGHVWQYAYTTAGKLATVTAPLPQGNRSFWYDANQYLRTETTAESGVVTFVPNAIGQITSRTDARRVLTTYRHDDPLSRLTNVQWGTDDDVTQRYDRANNLEHVQGRNSGAFDYQHDEVNRVTLATWEYRGVPYVTGYQFDAMGCLQRVTYPTGTTVRMTCDGLNRPTSVTIQRPGGLEETVVSAVSYHPSGQPEHYAFGNQVTTDVHYDDHARLRTLMAVGGGSQNVAGLTYAYDGAGNVVSFENTAEARSARTMIYDALDRVRYVVAYGQWGTLGYDYDVLGNRTAVQRDSGTTTFVYDPGTNRLAYSTGPGPKAQSLTWDEPGRLATSSDRAAYVYDGTGRRIQKTDASGTTVYHYDAAGRLIAETSPDGSKLRDYVYLGNKLIAVDGCVTAGPQAACTEREWYHTDALGSVLARTDASGNVTAQFDYEPFGERWNAAGLVAGVDGDRQYNGRVYDAGTGFHDYGARLYWPEIGRFVSADSYLGDPARPMTLNRYSYVLNNPYKYVDPTGRTTVQVGLSGSVVLGWGFALSGSIGFAFDDKGNIGAYAAAGPTTGVGLHAAVGGTFQFSNANEIADLRGPFVGISAGGGYGGDATGDAFVGQDRNKETILGGGLTAGAGAGAGATLSYTQTKLTYLRGKDPEADKGARAQETVSPPQSKPEPQTQSPPPNEKKE